MADNFIFPKGFYWGASTASHQVEGGHKNDWTEWEISPEREAWLHANGEIEKYGHDNFISGSAVDHRSLFKEDFKLASEFGHNASRFSIEWSRIEPEEGKFDDHEIHHYKNVIDEVKMLGMEPFVTLWHWPIPLWLRDKGGWENPLIVEHFKKYVEKMVLAVGPEVKFWITLNEAEIYTGMSYMNGVWPPQKKNPLAYWRVTHNLIRAHRAAYHIIHRLQPDAKVGVATNNAYIEPYPNNIINRQFAKVISWWGNFYFLNRIKDQQDFIGLNHYFHLRVNYWRIKNENARTSDLGWELYPEAIYRTLLDLKRYNKPVYITENGLADAKDKQRGWFLIESLKNVHRAIGEGVDVRGYLHWSLMDNFEWAYGYWPQFGLIEITDDLKRVPRPSCYLYKDICQTNGLTPETLEKYKDICGDPLRR